MLKPTQFCTITKPWLRKASFWSKVPMAPPDPILGLIELYKKDQNFKKVNLGVGAFRDNEGKPYVLPCVRKAEENIRQREMNKEYDPLAGDPAFRKAATVLALGAKSRVVQEECYATCQGVAGTGSIRLGAEFFRRLYPGSKVIYMPQPTWSNHVNIFEDARISCKYYRYYDSKTKGLDMKGLLEDLNKVPEKSVVLFHACAHNPTGVDPSKEQWKELSALAKKKKVLPFFDMAYQGFASGNFDDDAFSPRLFVEDGMEIILAQSFSKNMGLYGERCGACIITTESEEVATKFLSQLKAISRGLYSSTPINGSRIALEVMTDPELLGDWQKEVAGMSARITAMRKKLKESLIKAGSKLNWDHITNQIGMFCFTGLTQPQVNKLIKEYSIYLTEDGRISVAGLTPKNVEYVAEAIHTVTK